MTLKQMNGLNDYAEIIYHSKSDEKVDIESDLTFTRKTLVENIDAHIVLGGKEKDFLGKLPGILEEFILAIEKNLPIFLIGSFGGATRTIAEIVMKKRTHNLPKHFDLISKYEISSLNNGLNVEENKILFTTKDADVIVALILKGLGKVC